MLLEEFDYPLPRELIAQHPLAEREASRMMVLHRVEGRAKHTTFICLPEYLRSGDCLVLNDTRVVPARLKGRRVGTGGAVEFLLANRTPEGWWVLARPARTLKPGKEVAFGDGSLVGRVVGMGAGGNRLVEFNCSDSELRVALDKYGRTPLPPYIEREDTLEDRERYQTVYASHEGSCAAPTAGLHFRERTLERLERGGVRIARLTLHIGPTTFQPVLVERVEEHTMGEEAFSIPDHSALLINQTKSEGGRVVAVGTTVVRTLESNWTSQGLRPGEGGTDLFIYPGYEFQGVDCLLTNFHLPRSTLLMLVAAFAGRERLLNAYAEAIRLQYRFYSYGDCMLIL